MSQDTLLVGTMSIWDQEGELVEVCVVSEAVMVLPQAQEEKN